MLLPAASLAAGRKFSSYSILEAPESCRVACRRRPSHQNCKGKSSRATAIAMAKGQGKGKKEKGKEEDMGKGRPLKSASSKGSRKGRPLEILSNLISCKWHSFIYLCPALFWKSLASCFRKTREHFRDISCIRRGQNALGQTFLWLEMKDHADVMLKLKFF